MWQTLTRFTTPFGHVVSKHRSTRTGLSVVLASLTGPLVNGFFALATEALDDDGCPHTLEHLVFLGSEDYPFKGVLDRMANRALAQGTNAWTDTDNTVYTITTAGSEGFLQVLPVYLDHILYPTLTDSGCYTEVHHVNGNGEDAGVVYSEMQGRENSSSDRLQRRMMQLLYPEGSGYRSETGGLMANLRTLTVDKIRDYHKSYYRPDNLCIIVTGNVTPEAIFKALAPLEEKIVSKGPLPLMKRPWVESAPIPPIVGSIVETVEFPEENDTSVGEVYIAWRGPRYDEFEAKDAIDILSDYLTDSAVSLLMKTFCEIAEPLCSSVDMYTVDNLEGAIYLCFSNVPTEKLEAIQPMLTQTLSDHTVIDMDRIRLLIQRERLKRASEAETSPHYTYAMPALADHVYGRTDGSQLERVMPIPDHLNSLDAYTAAEWIGLIRKYLLSAPSVCVLGLPSPRLAKEIREIEAERIREQREALGQAKLDDLAKRLDEANAVNSADVPFSLLENIKVPSINTIALVPVESSRSSQGELNTRIKHNLQAHQVGLDIQFDQVQSTFVEIRLLIDTSHLSSDQRLWLGIYLDAFFEVAIERDGHIVSYEEVVKQLDMDTVENFAVWGVNGSFVHYMHINMKVELSKYSEGVRWAYELLFKAHYTADRLQTVASKLLQDIPSQKRDGSTMASMALKALAFDKEASNHVALSAVVQQPFLISVLKRLGGKVPNLDEEEDDTDDSTEEDSSDNDQDDDEDCESDEDGGGEEGEDNDNPDDPVDEEARKAVVNELFAVQKALGDVNRFVIQVVGDISKLEDPARPWKDHFGALATSAVKAINLPELCLSHRHLSARGRNPHNMGVVVNLSAIESSFGYHAAAGPSSYLDKDVPALLVLGEYLSMMEGVFWKKVRGLGLAYSCDVRTAVDQALVQFVVRRSPDCSKAFKQVQDIVHDLAAGIVPFEEADVRAAKAGVLFSIIEREDTVSAASLQTFVNQVLKHTTIDGTRRLLENVQNVSSDDLKHVLDKYIQRMFQPDTALTAITTAPSKGQDISSAFASLGYKLGTLPTVDALVDALSTLD